MNVIEYIYDNGEEEPAFSIFFLEYGNLKFFLKNQKIIALLSHFKEMYLQNNTSCICSSSVYYMYVEGSIYCIYKKGEKLINVKPMYV